MFGKPDAWYGQSLVTDQAVATHTQDGKGPTGGTAMVAGETAMRVKTVDLQEITKNHEIIDYVHMDIQGSEYEVLSAYP